MDPVVTAGPVPSTTLVDPGAGTGRHRRPGPTVSVVVPCYNYGRYLEQCVRSTLDQVGVQVRVLIIDDASTDDTEAVGRALAAAHPEVELRRHDVNAGHIATYNEGLLEWADGDYVALLSADDVLTPGSLRRSTSLMEEHPSVGMVYGRALDYDGGPVPELARARRTARTRVSPGEQWLAKRCREAVNVVPTPGVVVRTRVQREVGGYRPELPHAGDLEMWLRIAARSDVGYVRDVPQALYRVHGSSMSQGVYADPLADVRQRKAVFDLFHAERTGDPRTIAAARAQTATTLATEPLWRACRAYERDDLEGFPLAETLDLARECCADLERLRGYRALRRRQRLGARLCHRTQVFAPTAVVRRLRNELWWSRWRRYGG